MEKVIGVKYIRRVSRKVKMSRDKLQNLISSIYKNKEKRKKALAKLPFEEKIKILLRLQEIADEIASVKTTGKKRRRFKRWEI